MKKVIIISVILIGISITAVSETTTLAIYPGTTITHEMLTEGFEIIFNENKAEKEYGNPPAVPLFYQWRNGQIVKFYDYEQTQKCNRLTRNYGENDSALMDWAGLYLVGMGAFFVEDNLTSRVTAITSMWLSSKRISRHERKAYESHVLLIMNHCPQEVE